MIAPAALLLYAMLVAALGARLLRGAEWAQRSPRLGIAAWQALTFSVVVSMVLAGAALALPSIHATASLAELLRACVDSVREQYTTPAGAIVSIAGLLLALLVAGRAVIYVLVGLLSARRTRSNQVRALTLVARRRNDLDALIVEHPARAAYCLPGRGRHVVLTSAALACLEEDQLVAVLAHERAHLSRRHDLVLAVAGALARAFPRVQVFAVARDELACLVEMHADDIATGTSGRRSLAVALVGLADSRTPEGAIGASSTSTLARVRRLVAPAHPLGIGVSTLTGLGIATVLLTPMALAAAPALASALTNYCPFPLPA